MMKRAMMSSTRTKARMTMEMTMETTKEVAHPVPHTYHSEFDMRSDEEDIDEEDVSDAEIDEHDSLDGSDDDTPEQGKGVPGEFGVIEQHQKLQYDPDDDDDSSEGRC